MKWAIIVLIVLGVLAALSAALLVSSLRVDLSASARGSPDAEVLLAKTSLPAMSVITSDHVVKEVVSKNKLPEGYVSSPVQAIGRILAVPVVEGQVLTQSCFVTAGTGAQLAAALPYGMRAVSVTLTQSAVTGGLLYPGCVVDVLASFRLSSTDRSKGQAISTTLLHGIQVLAVEDTSIVSKKDDKEKTAGSSRGGHLSVTLMVDPRQAEALQLAMGHGSISLAMRNPLDRYPVNVDATVLSEGRLAKLGSAPTPSVFASKKDRIGQGSSDGTVFLGDQRQANLSPQWGVTVIRGRDVSEEELEIAKREFIPQTDAEE